MIIIYYQIDSCIHSQELSPKTKQLLQNALWIDIINPTNHEEKIVEEELNLEIPTKQEAEEIEPSSRLYIENETIYMTASMVALSDLPEVRNDVVTFILTKKNLITLRYTNLHAFDLFSAKLLRLKLEKSDPSFLLIELLDAAADRLADILEKISQNYDVISKLIFHQKSDHLTTKENNYKNILLQIGANGDLGTKASESLISFIRLISYIEQILKSKERLKALTIIHEDVNALREHANFLSTKYNFLLDATLGMINIEQNNIIKIFSVAAVILLPPTLIASIYGMNFTNIPELRWYVGYPFAIMLMILSAVLPFRYFKKKKWL